MKKRNLCNILALGFIMLFLLTGCGLGVDPEKNISSVSTVENPVESDESGRYSAAALGIAKPDQIICYWSKKSVEFTPEDAEFSELMKPYELLEDQRLDKVKTLYSIYSEQVGENGEWIVCTYADSDKKIYFKLNKDNPNESNLLFIINAPGVTNGACYGYNGDISEFQVDRFC